MYQERPNRLCVDEMSTTQSLAQPIMGDPLAERQPSLAVLRAVPGLSAQRKFVTVLFIDVSDSMRLSRRIELEDWWSVSVRLFDVMSQGVHNFTGDGIEAVFEPSGKAADCHARRACRTALWLRDAIREPAAEVRSAHGLELSVRIGINSGEVIVGTIGHSQHGYYTANGYTVGLAKRTETLAAPNRIYLTENTAALLTRANAVQLCGRGAFHVKGADGPIEIFELLGSVDRC
jgi:class 3 adenylate cyclase